MQVQSMRKQVGHYVTGFIVRVIGLLSCRIVIDTNNNTIHFVLNVPD